MRGFDYRALSYHNHHFSRTFKLATAITRVVGVQRRLAWGSIEWSAYSRRYLMRRSYHEADFPCRDTCRCERHWDVYACGRPSTTAGSRVRSERAAGADVDGDAASAGSGDGLGRRLLALDWHSLRVGQWALDATQRCLVRGTLAQLTARMVVDCWPLVLA